MPGPLQLTLVLLPILLIILAEPTNANELTYFIFTPQCYQSLVESFNFKDSECIKLTVSKLLGYALVVGGAIVKFPQIIKILVNRSVYGISFFSIFMESLTNWVTIVYSWYRANPFSIYGENVFLLAQNVIILFLFIIFGRNVPKQIPDPGQIAIKKYAIVFLGFVTFMYFTQNPHIWPQIIITYILVVQMSLFSTARLTQIIQIYKKKSTGNLAFITFILVFLGNLGRLFTVLVQIGNDYLFALSIILAATLNGTIVTQFLIYWKNSNKVKYN